MNSKLETLNSEPASWQLAKTEMGESISMVTPGEGKNPASTDGDPTNCIDDDLFGYMNANARSQRTSPIRVESLVAINTYKGDLDYGTNFMGVDNGGEPNIYETEVNSGIYRGTILIELNRIGKGRIVNENKKTMFDDSDFTSNEVKQHRVLAFIDAFRTLWSTGRQSRFLADISPKFITAAYMSVKNPIFLESVAIDKSGKVNTEALDSVVSDYRKFISDHVLAGQKATLNIDESVLRYSYSDEYGMRSVDQRKQFSLITTEMKLNIKKTGVSYKGYFVPLFNYLFYGRNSCQK